MIWWLLYLALVVAAFGGAVAPARADYCEEQYGLVDRVRPVSGSCRSIRLFTIDGPAGPTQLEVWSDGGLALTPARTTAILDAIGEVARRVGPRLRDLGGRLGLPPHINLVIIAGSHPERRDAIAETFPISSQSASDRTLQCPQLIYNSALVTMQALQRTLSHEIFHCAHEHMLGGQMRQAGHEWWAEGSAEWFEDFTFPEHYRFANTNVAVQAFHDRSASVSMLKMSYETVVFFSWLQAERGAPAVASYLLRMAGSDTTQLAAARRALDDDAYTDFAQTYIDDGITLPSGTRVTGARVPQLGFTTGNPGADPDIERGTPEPLTLMRGSLDVVPGGYRPKGDYGTKDRVFSERRGSWQRLPASLVVQCGERRTFRFAAMSAAERAPAMKMKPGTDKAMQCGECGATGGGVRRAGCVVGTWRMVAGSGNCHILGSMMAGTGVSVNVEECRPGEASATFNPDGTFGGMLQNAKRRVSMQFPSRRGGREMPRMTAENFIALAKSAGLWKATEETGKLELCSTTTTGLGSMTMSGVGATRTRPMTFGPSAYVALNYTCSGDAMTITVPAQGAVPSFSVEAVRVAPAR